MYLKGEKHESSHLCFAGSREICNNEMKTIKLRQWDLLTHFRCLFNTSGLPG